MMIKYRVHEVAKDLGVASKEVIALLKEYLGQEKKHMTALNEDELNIIFEYYTQKNQSESIDEYFKSKGNVEEKTEKSDKSEPKKTVKETKKPTSNFDKKSNKPNSSKPLNKKAPGNNKQKFDNKIIITGSSDSGSLINSDKPQGKVINTRIENVNIDKYNEKYDRIASENVRTDNSVNKHNINQNSQQRNKF